MRIAYWNFRPKQSKYAQYTEDVARKEGLDYIEQLKLEDDVAEVIEESDKFIIKLWDKDDIRPEIIGE